MSRRKTLVLLAMVIMGLALQLQVQRRLVIDPSAIRHESGLCYITKIPSQINGIFYAWPDTMTHPQRSKTVLLENGNNVGIAHSQHENIRKIGEGRFSHWKDGRLYFSSSDGSDPRTNGKQYFLAVNIMFAGWARYLGLIAAIFAAAAYFFGPSRMFGAVSGAARYLPKKPKSFFWISCVIVTILFVLARLPWLLDLRMPFIVYDTGSYFVPVRQVVSGQWPWLLHRTPGYPIFLAVALAIVPKLSFVIALQVTLSYLSILFFLYSIYKTSGKLVILASFAMMAHASQPMLVFHDFTLITESLFSAIFLIFLGCFILATRRPRTFFLFITSLLCGYAIIVRPGGVFLAGVLFLGVFYLIFNRERPARIWALAVPAPLLLLALMSYNYLSTGVFSCTTVGSLTRAGVTAMYWDTDESFPDSVNTAIRDVQKEIPPLKSRVLAESWDPAELDALFQKWAVHVVHVCKHTRYLFQNQTKYLDLIASKAIKAHPVYAFKFFYSTLWCFLSDSASYRASMYANIKWVLPQMYIEGTASDKFVGREFSRFPARKALKIVDTPDAPGGRILVVDQQALRGEKLDSFIRTADSELFDRPWWHGAYFIVLLICAVRLAQTRFLHWGTFALFSLSATLLGAGIAVAMTTTMSDRYPAPTRFVEVLALCLAPLLWNREGRKDHEESIAASHAEAGMVQNSSALMHTTHNYYRWNLSVFPVGEGKRILDIGCGPCLYLDAILSRKPALYLATDCSPGFLNMATTRMKGLANCRAEYLDILDSDKSARSLSGQKFDHVLCFDVIEHLRDDQAALKGIREVMAATGAGDLFIRVPALPFIFGENDKAIGHFRRYTKASLRTALESAGFEVRQMRYQNIAGVIPWLVIGRLFRRSLAVAPGEGRLFDKAVPLLKWVEKVIPPPLGLSVYGIARIKQT